MKSSGNKPGIGWRVVLLGLKRGFVENFLKNKLGFRRNWS